MKIGQTVYIVSFCRHLPPGDYHFSLDKRVVISFDSDTVIVKNHQDIYPMLRSYVFECPFEAERNIERIMNNFDCEETKIREDRQILDFLSQFEGDQPIIKKNDS